MCHFQYEYRYGSYTESVPVIICEESTLISQALEGGQNFEYSHKYALPNSIEDDQYIIQSPRSNISFDDISVDSDVTMTDEE